MSYKNQEEKYFFSVYLNLARLNAYLTLSHITKLLGKKPSPKEESLVTMPIIEALNGIDQLLLQKSQRLILKHFPFFKAIVEKEKSKATDENKLLYDVCKLFFHFLNEWRNFYTHYNHAPVNFQDDAEKENFFKYLDFIFDASLRKGKERFTWDEKNLKRFRYKSGYDKVKKLPKENPDFQYQFHKNNDLTEKGFIYFVCMFLERKDSADLINALAAVYNFQKTEESIFREIYSIYAIRIPHHRVESTDSMLTLGLDILNELKRFPKSLYEILRKSEKETFIENIKDEGQNETNFKRFNERFPYFALNFIDELKLFKDYRFHVKLGKYYFQFYDKNTVDGEIRKRDLSVNLKTFGRINEVNDVRKKDWKDLIWDDNEGETPTPPKEYAKKYITNSFPRYILESNQIGLKKVPNVSLPELNDKKTRCLAPDCYLSVFELPALIFYGLLLNKNREAEAIMTFLPIELVIVKFISSVKKFFKHFHGGKSNYLFLKNKFPIRCPILQLI